MAWTAPPTAIANTALAAATWNAGVRDNLLETAPAKASKAGSLFVSDGVNSIVERTIGFDEVLTAQQSSSTTYDDLATVGPQVTVDTGTRALYILSAQSGHSADNSAVRTSIEVTGATSISPGDSREMLIDGLPGGQALAVSWAHLETQLNPGSNTFTMKYRVTVGTGTWSERRLIVLPF